MRVYWRPTSLLMARMSGDEAKASQIRPNIFVRFCWLTLSVML